MIWRGGGGGSSLAPTIPQTSNVEWLGGARLGLVGCGLAGYGAARCGATGGGRRVYRDEPPAVVRPSSVAP